MTTALQIDENTYSVSSSLSFLFYFIFLSNPRIRMIQLRLTNLYFVPGKQMFFFYPTRAVYVCVSSTYAIFIQSSVRPTKCSRIYAIISTTHMAVIAHFSNWPKKRGGFDEYVSFASSALCVFMCVDVVFVCLHLVQHQIPTKKKVQSIDSRNS